MSRRARLLRLNLVCAELLFYAVWLPAVGFATDFIDEAKPSHLVFPQAG